MELSMPSNFARRDPRRSFYPHLKEQLHPSSSEVFFMKAVLWTSLFLLLNNAAFADVRPANGVASWYGEEHRGRLMANGKRFNPDKLTAASWFYPLGTKVQVTFHSPSHPPR